MEYAYNSEDLEANLVLGESSYRGICNLDNDIHPMWNWERFRAGNAQDEVRMLKRNSIAWDRSTTRLDKRTYQRMEPGLRLASLFLEHSGPFFSQLLHGQLQFPELRRLQPYGPLEEWRVRSVNVVGNPHNLEPLFGTQLKKFADHVAETSLIYVPSNNTVGDAWAENRTTLDDRCRYAIALGSVFTDVICQPQWHKISAQSRRYYNFQLAVTLVHELAHVAWRYRRWDDILLTPSTEHEEAVLSPDEEQIELGQSWEIWFFGGELRPIDTDEEPPRWLGFAFCPFTIDSGNEESIAYRDCRFGGHAITALCINRFFQKQRWEAHIDGSVPFAIDLTTVSSLTSYPWDADIDDGFLFRMTLNNENQTDPRPPLVEEP